MCGTRNPGGRPVALLALLLQLALAAALPLAHARAEAAAFSHDVHIQTEGDGACLPHNDIGCHFCRLRSAADLLTDPARTPTVPFVLTVTGSLAAGSTGICAPPLTRVFGPRAPPHA